MSLRFLAVWGYTLPAIIQGYVDGMALTGLPTQTLDPSASSENTHGRPLLNSSLTPTQFPIPLNHPPSRIFGTTPPRARGLR